MTAAVAPKSWLSDFLAVNNKHNIHTTPPKTHIACIMPHPKGIGNRHKSGIGNNQGRQ